MIIKAQIIMTFCFGVDLTVKNIKEAENSIYFPEFGLGIKGKITTSIV